VNAPSRFDDLLRLWRDGEASAAELAELEGLLRGDARYRRSLARSIQLEVDLYARYAASRGAAAPTSRRWRLEAVAAVLAVGVSLLAAGAFLLRPEVFPVGRSIEASGSARLRLQDGPDILLDPGSSGAYVSPGVFELRRGGASVDAGRALRLVTPSGAVSGSGFSARVDLPGLRVAVGQGRVEVDYDGLRHSRD
jgi:ferric-dicitrate binding protein FerR (iron transport regulator)